MQTNPVPEKYCVISKCYGKKASYAKIELEKYIYLLTGRASDEEYQGNCDYRIIFTLELIPESEKEKFGEEGYEIRTSNNETNVTISAPNEQGILYGVYGLLSDYYHVGFYFSGDAIAQSKSPLPLISINECKIPKQSIRGILPWTNFPQSATSYSIQDWIFIIDQMTRMRLNFLNIHNYNGELGHNEIFHNIMLNGKISRNWNATVSKPHAWGMKGWDPNQYLFGGSELFDDYDFGADATLHNDCLDNIDVFKKGSSEFAMIISYAHTRGVKIGLGLDLNLVTSDYSESADSKTVVTARINQILTDYPQLDYLMLYRSENSPDFTVWNRAFEHIYQSLKERAAHIRVAVSGWGLDPDTIIGLPADVIAAPISGHGVNDRFPNGKIYGDREFWACPWAERDYNDSIHFAPYHTLLSNTIACYQNCSKNTSGFMTLTWRLSDGVDAKLSYIAEAPWDTQNLLVSSEAAYHRYAVKCYGAAAADMVTEIINENEAYATNASECLYTPSPTGNDRSADIAKADQQLAVIDSAIAAASDTAWRERLKKLRCRIQAVKSFCLLDMNMERMDIHELYSEFTVFVRGFIERIDDISTLGNLFSVENRYVQEWFLSRAAQLQKIHKDSFFLPSVSVPESLRVLVVSPVTAIDESNFVDFKAIILNSTAPESLTVFLFWRKAGALEWSALPMQRKVKNIYGVRIEAADLPKGVIEYYIEAADNSSIAYYPSTAPLLCAAFSNLFIKSDPIPEAPQLKSCENGRLRWTPCNGDILWYRIYRGAAPEFTVGPQSFVTFVYRDSLTYWDVSKGFDGKRLNGDYYYKVSCVDTKLQESEPSNPVCCSIYQSDTDLIDNFKKTESGALQLNQIDLNGDTAHLFLSYGSTGTIKVQLWADGTDESSGRLIGNTELCPTGSAAVREIGELSLTQPVTEAHALFLTVTPAGNAKWKIYSCYPSTGILREPVITTDSDSFAIGPACKRLHLFIKDIVDWSVREIDGTPASGITIDQNGVLNAQELKNIRVVSQNKDGILCERLITASDPVRASSPQPFRDFWIISELIGCDEMVEIGGLASGYDYTCLVRDEQGIICSLDRFAGGSFKIPAAHLTAGHRYKITVSAIHSDGDKKEITHSFKVTSDGLQILNSLSLLGVKERHGTCAFHDEWNICTEGSYEVTEEGLQLTTRSGDLSARFTFRLPLPYTPELPHLLVKAASFYGDWTFQINQIPIVGPKENDIAVRKDLRAFSLESGQPIDVTFIITSPQKDQIAQAIFKSIQLLP